MANLTQIAEKIGEVRADVRGVKSDVVEVAMGLADLGARLGKVEEQLRTRTIRERLIWAVVTTMGVASWGAIGLIPWRVWAAIVKALGAP